MLAAMQLLKGSVYESQENWPLAAVLHGGPPGGCPLLRGARPAGEQPHALDE